MFVNSSSTESNEKVEARRATDGRRKETLTSRGRPTCRPRQTPWAGCAREKRFRVVFLLYKRRTMKVEAVWKILKKAKEEGITFDG